METVVAVLITIMVLMWSADDSGDNDDDEPPSIHIEIYINDEKQELDIPPT